MSSDELLRRLFSVEDKVVVVTGGSRGIGKMIAEGFVEAGARVYISSRSAETCAETVEELSKLGTCEAFPAHLGTLEGIQALAAAVAERESSVHVLVNNAGAIWEQPIDEYDDDAFDKLLNINLRATFRLTKALLPQLRAAATLEDPARVINVGSIDAMRVPLFETYAYSSSKAAQHMLSQHLALRLGPDNITVNVIAPGTFPTKMTKPVLGTEEGRQRMMTHNPIKRFGTPDNAAGMALFLASPSGSYTTGAVIPLDGGMFLMPG